MTAIEDEATQLPDEPEAGGRLLWRNRDYTGWWLGESVSEFGSALSLVAFPLLILAVTGSAARAGFVESAAGIGALTTMLIGGALADRSSLSVHLGEVTLHFTLRVHDFGELSALLGRLSAVSNVTDVRRLAAG